MTNCKQITPSCRDTAIRYAASNFSRQVRGVLFFIIMNYRNCRFCKGRGCLGCEGEAEKDYKRQFPNGPQPIATISTEEMSDIEKLELLQRLLNLNSQDLNSIVDERLKSPFGKLCTQIADKETARSMFYQKAAHDQLIQNAIKEGGKT